MRRAVIALVAAALTVVGASTPATEAAAASNLRITKVYVNSPGADHRSKKSLNAEWIRIENTSSKARNLTGYTIRDRGSLHVYRFSTFNLGAHKTVTVHTGPGHNTKSVRYWGLDNYVWNNDGDKAVVRTKAGTTVDTCPWTTVRSWVAC